MFKYLFLGTDFQLLLINLMIIKKAVMYLGGIQILRKMSSFFFICHIFLFFG